MTVTCERTLLHAALSHAIRAVNPSATVDVLRGVLLRAEGDTLTVIGNDMELGIVAPLVAEIEQSGTAVFNAKLFAEIVKKASGDTVTISVTPRMQANIQSGSSVFDMTVLPADNYPEIPKVDKCRKIVLPKAALKRQLSQTLFAVADGSSKGVHTGVLFDVESEKLTLVALNGHRLALRHEAAHSDEAFRFVVPGKSLHEIEKMLSGNNDMVTIHIGERHALVDLPGYVVVTRLLDGEFLEYRNAIPSNFDFSATVGAESMLSALERVGLLITERLKNPVKLTFSESRLQLFCQTPLGRAQDDIGIECEGELEIGFNHRYLVEALRRMESDQFSFKAAGTLSPCLLVPEDDENALFMVLPVRLKEEVAR